LRQITVNRLRNFWQSRANRLAGRGGDFETMLDQLADPSSDLSRLWDQQHDEHVVRRALDLIEPDFEATTWQAFHQVTRGGIGAAQVADNLGITVNAVFIAKSRVLARLRQEIQGLID
jgi:RNA polymerase sigma-70 factor (ECF subfamily)